MFLDYGYMAVMDTAGGGRILGNTSGTGYGGVLLSTKGTVTFKDCVFTGNIATQGSAVSVAGATTITGCTFTNINGEAIGYVASSVSADFESAVIANNTGLTAENVIGY